jgi:hypothetical protein
MYNAITIPNIVDANRTFIQNDLLDKSSHLTYKGIIIIKTGITIKVQLNKASMTTVINVKRSVLEFLVELSNRIAVANATEIAPAVAVMNPSSKKVPSERDVNARAEAGASMKKTDFLEETGSTTSQTAANAYPIIAISNPQVKDWLVQSDISLVLESFPISVGVPEFKNTEMTFGK